MKVWDVRNLTDAEDTNTLRKERCLQTLEHDKPVNSAYFSHVDGTRLLTTDQHSQLRVYKGKEGCVENELEDQVRFQSFKLMVQKFFHSGLNAFLILF